MRLCQVSSTLDHEPTLQSWKRSHVCIFTSLLGLFTFLVTQYKHTLV